MFKYKIDVLEKLKEKGYSAYKLAQNGYFGGASIQQMRNNEVLGKTGLETLCKLLECDISDIIEYVPDNQ